MVKESRETKCTQYRSAGGRGKKKSEAAERQFYEYTAVLYKEQRVKLNQCTKKKKDDVTEEGKGKKKK